MEKKHVFGERFRELRLKKGITQEQIAEMYNVTRPAVGNWEKEAIPREPILSSLADLFGVSLDYLLGRDMPEQKKTPIKGVKIPVLGTIIAGVPIDAVTDILGYEEIHPDLAKTGEFFGLKVKGDSMTPRICEGDVVIVRKQPDVECGQLAVVLINGEEATLKKVIKKEDGIVLEAFNPIAYSPKFYSWEDIEKLPIQILGKVVQSMRMW